MLSPMLSPRVTLRTVAERNAELIRRESAANSTRAAVGSMCDAAERANTLRCAGCWSGLWRLVYRDRTLAASEGAQAEGAVVSSAAKASTMFARCSPQQKLEQASAGLRARAERMETKVAEERARAQRLAKTDKQAALRALKKSKQLRSQADSALGALDTLESQQDLLEHAALQQTITAALGKQMKGLKGTKKLLATAEAASEGAIELKDLVDDVGQILSETNSGSGGNFDDDELLAELEEMARGDDGGGTVEPQTAAAPTKQTREELRAEVVAEEARAHEELKEAHVVMRDAPSVPTTPAKVQERQALLVARG